MTEVLVLAAGLCAASALTGRAVLALAAGLRAPRAFSWLAPAIGFATLIVLAAAGSGLADGAGAAIAIAAGLATAAAVLALRRAPLGRGRFALGALVAVAAVLIAAIPFFAAGHPGVLGVGLINDDMASHLQIAEHIRDPLADPPRFVEGGYPIGPHALVAGLAEGLGTSLVDAFAALSLALAGLLAITLLAALTHLPPGRRALAALVSALAYLSAAYLGQGAFKEPLEALILIGFALYLAELVGLGADEPAVPGDRPAAWRAVPLGLLAAASILNYSIPGLVWLAAVAAAILFARYFLIGPRRQHLAIAWRRLVPYALAALAIAVVATAQEWSRIADFTRLDAFRPDRVGSDLGNLRDSLNPLELFGIWPTGDFRTAAADAGGPTILFWAAGLFALAVTAIGSVAAWAWQRVALPGALGVTIAVWGAAELIATPYFAAKALAIGAPIAMAVALGWALDPGSRWRAAVATVLILGAGASTFSALRTSPVAPGAHAAELERLRHQLEGSDVLFLGRDDFIGWELRRANVTGVVKNHFNVDRVPARYRNPQGGGDKFDIDAVTPKGLRRFDYVLATRGDAQSAIPAELELVEETETYALYEIGEVGPRRTLAEGAEPGAPFRCPKDRLGGRQRDATAYAFTPAPLFAGAAEEVVATDGAPARLEAEIRTGHYRLDIAYDSRRELEITITPPPAGDGERSPVRLSAPANLDFRGPVPHLPVGELDAEHGGTYVIEIEPVRPGRFARLLGAPNDAHVRGIALTRPGPRAELPLAQACGRYVDYYVP